MVGVQFLASLPLAVLTGFFSGDFSPQAMIAVAIGGLLGVAAIASAVG